MTDSSPQDIDKAKTILEDLLARRGIMGADDPDQSEADTRAKLIDPIFKGVLGWLESDINREEPAGEDFADYTLGLDYKWLHIEAKRTLPRFQLHMQRRQRRVALSGAHLLGNKCVRPLIEQAAKYSFNLGTEFAVLTNGTQLILFRAIVRGHAWTEGSALVWHDTQDILQNFAEFYELLAKTSVESGALAQTFATALSLATPTFSPLQYVYNPDAELVRNPFWNKIAQAFNPILTDQPENAALQEEIIRNCYVSTPLANESTSDLSRLLADLMPRYLVDAGVRDLQLEDRGRHSFREQVVDHLKLSKPGTYVLTGGVGSGKTTFLRRYSAVEKHSFIATFCVWLQVDFLGFGNPTQDDQAGQIASYTYAKIRTILETSYPQDIPTDGEGLRHLFEKEISELKQTRLFGVSPEAAEYNSSINQRVAELASSVQSYVAAVIRKIRSSGRAVVFVLDNTDQQGEAFQKEVFLFSQRLADTYSTLAIVSLREEKFFAAYRQGVFDAYGTRKFHIGSPDLIAVLKRRLEYGVARYKELSREQGVAEHERSRIERVLRTLVNASTQRNGNIIRFLSCVSAGDMRLALRLFADFMSSGNTNVTKIEGIVAKDEIYWMPFHEFAKSAILGARRYYKANVARVLNLFACSGAPQASHWTGCRMLARLVVGQKVASSHGEGFIPTRTLIKEYREAFGTAEDFVETGSRFLAAGLMESEPPRSDTLGHTECIRISATGAYYWHFLVRSFAYLDLVYVDTPVADENLAKWLAQASEPTKRELGLREFMQLRFQRVRHFLDHLEKCETNEIQQASQQGGVYGRQLSKEIRDQVEKEMALIEGRVRCRRR